MPEWNFCRIFNILLSALIANHLLFTLWLDVLRWAMGKMRNCGMRNAEGKMQNGNCGATVIGRDVTPRDRSHSTFHRTPCVECMEVQCMNYGHFGPKTLRGPGHFGTSLVGPNCPDRLTLVPKCLKDSSDLSAELSCPKCRTVPSQVPKCLGQFLKTIRYVA